MVCTRGLYVLHDRDGDGRSEERTRILTIAPYEKRANPHGQMQGITFSPDGWVYVGRGAHVGGEYAWVGADGKELPGQYDGGDIVRSPGRKRLERVGTASGIRSGSQSPPGPRHRLDNDSDGAVRTLLHIGRWRYGTDAVGRFGCTPTRGEAMSGAADVTGRRSADCVIDAKMARLPAEVKDSRCLGWGENNSRCTARRRRAPRSAPRARSFCRVRVTTRRMRRSGRPVSPQRRMGRYT